MRKFRITWNISSFYWRFDRLEGDIPVFERTRVRVNEGTTSEATNIVKGLLAVIGTVHEIVHYRLSQKIKYVTFIQGKNFDVVIDGGLTSGYVGTGPGGFSRILEETGITKDEAEKIAHTRYVDGEELRDAVITIKYL